MGGTLSDSPARDSALQSGLRKARWRILPLLSACYLVAYMDRTNISFAAESMNRDLHFTPKIYGLGAGLFFLTYALCEVPSNALMLRFGARRWLSRIMLTWGLIAGAMVFVRTPLHFYGARLLLGCAEAGYFPGALYYLAQWFPSAVRARAISLFYAALPVSSIVMGSVAGSLLRMNGTLGLRGWQWMFLVEASPAVLLAFVLWFCLPEKPSSARWLSAEEQSAMQQELTPPLQSASGHSDGMRQVIRSSGPWIVGLAFFCQLAASYSIVFSLPLVLKQLTHWDAGRVGYLIAASGVLGAAVMLGGAWFTERTARPRPFIVCGYGLAAVGSLLAGIYLAGWFAVAAVLLVQLSYYAVQGPLLNAATTVLPGRTAAIAIAFANMCGICGGFVGPYWMGWIRETTGGYAWGIGPLAVLWLIAAAAMGWLLRDRRSVASSCV